MTIQFTDNALSNLASDINSTDTIVSVEVGQGARFPNVANGLFSGNPAFFVITLEDSSGNREFVRVDHRVGDVFGDATFPCTRGYWGSTARSFSAADTSVDIRWTKDGITELFGSYVQKSGDTMTGFLTLNADPTSNLHAAPKQYVDVAFTNHNASGDHDSRYVNVTGDTMTGALTLPADPSSNLQAATKQYVDNSIAALQGVPTGTVLDFAGTTAPTGYLICDGSNELISNYSALFAVIGTTWGGDGTTTFGLPDLRRRVTVGSGGAGTSVLNDIVGSLGGTETHTLSTSEMPSHNHSLTIDSVGDHRHNILTANTFTGTTSGVTYDSNPVHGLTTAQTELGGGHNHGGSIGNKGSGASHNNMQPSAVMLKIIKT